MFVSKTHRPLGYLLKSFVKKQPAFSQSKQAFLETFSAISKKIQQEVPLSLVYTPSSSAQVFSLTF